MKRFTLFTAIILWLMIPFVFQACKKNPQPIANFTATPTYGTAPLTVNFTDQSTNTPTSWQWDFGDGNSSTQQNPTHTYSNAGTYSIILIAINSSGSNAKTQNNLIVVYSGNSAPVANFTATPTSGTAPLTVTFTDQSTNTPTSWYWDFGDGITSTVQNPEHIYNTNGSYTVLLTVSNTSGSDVKTNTDYISISNTFTDPREGQVYNTVTIGNQTWFAENLNYETVNSWWYDNNSTNGDIYGRLYTWDAAITACPSGWHLPSNEEWFTLIDYLGGDIAGGKMKETGTAHWNSPNIGATNSSGFSALPAGHLYDGMFTNMGYSGDWWSTNTDYSGMSGYYYSLGYDYDNISYGLYNYKSYGYSVRCLKN